MATQTATKPSLTIKRRLNAPPAKVFAAWTDPEKVKGWIGPGEVKALHAECDLRVGGRYRWLMRAPSGEEHDVGGVYREVVPNREAGLHLGLEDHAGARVAGHRAAQARRRRHLADADPRAVLRRDARDRHHGGWNGALDKLAKFLA